jgi:Ribbon-helix-helix protein, copG family
MKTLSLKLPDDMARILEDRARSTGTTKSEILREALAGYLAQSPPPGRGSFLALAGDLVGCLEGPGDLSYNKEYLENYGR